MTQRFIIHHTVDIGTGEPLQTYYTQNPIPEDSTFEVSCGGKILLFRLEQHFISNEKLSLVEFLEEKT